MQSSRCSDLQPVRHEQAHQERQRTVPEILARIPPARGEEADNGEFRSDKVEGQQPVQEHQAAKEL